MDSYTPPEMTLKDKDDQPIITLETVIAYIQVFLASVGIIAIAIFAGLYASGFFTWLAKKMPESKTLAFLFG